jgi:hypothetical protein
VAPIADVGGSDPAQNFVQRAGAGIFYGLETGQFYSDDIGGSQILSSAPVSTGNLEDMFVNIGPLAGDSLPEFSPANVNTDLSGALASSGAAGQTIAASSTRSTAASQRDDEEDTTEVDELAFQNLKNYDENPQGILLPEDQQFAYDREGNIYFMITIRSANKQPERIPLYRVDLELNSNTSILAGAFPHNYEVVTYTPMAIDVFRSGD